MHVLEIIHGLQPGGAESALIRRLKYQPDDVRTTVLTSTPVPHDVVNRLGSSGVALARRQLSWRDSRWLREFLTTIQADVIVSHSPRETMNLLAWNLHGSVPLVVVAHHSQVSDSRRNRHLKELAFRLLNRRADLHIAVSMPASEGAQCAAARRVEVHLLGAELDPPTALHQVWPEGTRLRFMTLSRLIGFKNLTGFVEAVAMEGAGMRAVGAHVAVVGSGPMHEEIADSINRFDVADLVSMQGFVPNPASLLLQADTLVNCAVSEGGPLTIYEASLAGARLLSTPTGVAAEVLAGDSGSVITAGSSPADLATGIRRMLALGPLEVDERARRAATAVRWSSRERAPGFYRLVRSVC